MRYLEGDEAEKALEYIMKAAEVAVGSTCERRKCGSVIVKLDEIIGSGFNSPPGDLEGQRRCQCHKKDYHIKVTDKTCCVHAEQRAIMDALAKNPDKLEGSRLYYANLDPEGDIARAGRPYCTICSKMTLDAGIAEFVLWDEKGVCVYDADEYNDISFRFGSENP